jgi:O-antigen/teichoic acid export membrane protein
MVDNKLIKSSIWYILSGFLLKALGFITIPIYTRLLTKAEFGLFSNFSSWLSIFMIIGTLSLSSSLISARFDYGDDLDSYILSILALGSLITVTIYIVVRINIEYFQTLLSLDKFYIDFMFSYIIISQAILIFQNIQRFQYKYKESVFVNIFTSLGSVLLSFLLVVKLEDKFLGRTVGHYIPLIGINLFFYTRYLIKGKKIKIKYWKYALSICIPFVPHLLSLTVLSASDRTMITSIRGPSDTAMYSIAYSIGSIITILWSSINSAFSPWLGEKIHENKIKVVYNMSTMYVLIVAIPVVGIMLIAPEILLFMGGKKYVSAMYVMPPVMLGCLFQYAYTMYVNVEQFVKKTVGMAIASVSVAIINVSLNLLFIPIYGYIAAAYTTLISYGILFVFHYALVRKIGLYKLYNTKNIVFILIFAILITISVNILYSSELLRYGITVIYFLIILYYFLKNKRKIISLLKS